jgi:hypothetical protein
MHRPLGEERDDGVADVTASRAPTATATSSTPAWTRGPKSSGPEAAEG